MFCYKLINICWIRWKYFNDTHAMRVIDWAFLFIVSIVEHINKPNKTYTETYLCSAIFADYCHFSAFQTLQSGHLVAASETPAHGLHSKISIRRYLLANQRMAAYIQSNTKNIWRREVRKLLFSKVSRVYLLLLNRFRYCISITNINNVIFRNILVHIQPVQNLQKNYSKSINLVKKNALKILNSLDWWFFQVLLV